MKTMLDAFEREFDLVRARIKQENIDITSPEFGMIEVDIPLNIAIGGEICIVDIETTGIDHNKNKMVTFGVIHDSYLRVIQRANMSKESFDELIRGFIERELQENGIYTIYAYNCSFEKRFLNVDMAFEEIMPYRISKDNCISFDHFGFGVGKDVPAWWHKWEKTHDLDLLRDIMKHNVNCLLKEFAIFSVNYSNYVED